MPKFRKALGFGLATKTPPWGFKGPFDNVVLIMFFLSVVKMRIVEK